MRIELLAAHAHHVPTLARWFHGEWNTFYAGRTPADVEADFRERLHADRLPLALVALDGDEAVGTVSLMQTSVPTHAHLTPWLGGLFVAPDHRSAGLGMELVDAAVHQARDLGITRLHVALHAGEAAYTDAGWVVLDRATIDDEPITVLVRHLATSS